MTQNPGTYFGVFHRGSCNIGMAASKTEAEALIQGGEDDEEREERQERLAKEERSKFRDFTLMMWCFLRDEVNVDMDKFRAFRKEWDNIDGKYGISVYDDRVPELRAFMQEEESDDE